MTSTEWNDKGGIVTLPTRYDVRDGVISPIDSDPSLFARLRLRSTSSHQLESSSDGNSTRTFGNNSYGGRDMAEFDDDDDECKSLGYF